MDCQSSWIIYTIECNICKLQYIGKSETAFNLWLNNHRNYIKKGWTKELDKVLGESLYEVLGT